MRSLNLLTICVIFALRSRAAHGAKRQAAAVQCTPAALEKADLCGEKLFFVGKNSRLFPGAEPESEKYCGQTLNLIQCVKRFTDRCAHNEMQRSLANVMLYTVRSHHRSVCGSKAKRAHLVTMSTCANKIRRKSSDCMSRMLTEFGQALGLRESRNRIPYACCAFHKMRDCIMEAADRAGTGTCSAKAKELFDQHISTMAGNTLELMCSDYDSESDRCVAVRRLKFDEQKAIAPKSLIRAFGDLLLADPDEGKVKKP